MKTCIKAPLFENLFIVKIQKMQNHLRGCVIFTLGENPQLNNNIGTWEINDDMKTELIIFNPKIEVNILWSVYYSK